MNLDQTNRIYLTMIFNLKKSSPYLDHTTKSAFYIS